MSVENSYEVVSIQALDGEDVRVGLASVGRIAQYAGSGSEGRDRGVVHADLFVDWPVHSHPSVGAVVTASFAGGEV